MDTKKNELGIVRKGNKLIEAKYDLNLNQQRILLGLLEVITPYDEDFKIYKICIATMAEKYNLEKNNALYSRIQEAVKGLVGNVLEILQENGKTLAISWLSSAEYRDGEGYADITFHPYLKPYLLMLKKHYTEYPMSAINSFKSSYSFRFYEWLQLSKYKGNGGEFYRIFTLEEIKDKMHISKKEYYLFADLKKRVIEPAVKEINKYSDLEIIAVEYIKIRNRVEKIKIIAKPKSGFLLEQEKAEEVYPKIYHDLLSIGIASETAKKWVKKYTTERIEQNLAYVNKLKKTTEIQNFQAYLATAIVDNMAQGWQDEEEKRRQIMLDKEEEERKKEYLEEKKRKQEKAENIRISSIYESQSLEMQNTLLNDTESLLYDNPIMLDFFKQKRANNKAHIHFMSLNYLKIIMKDKNLI